MKCSACGFKQDEGKFCAKCGGGLVDDTSGGGSEHQNTTEEKEMSTDTHKVDEPSVEGDQSQHAEPRERTQDLAAATTAQTTNASPESEPAPKESIFSNRTEDSFERVYWIYIKTYIKRPSAIFKTREKEFINGIINILITIFMGSLSFFMLINGFAKSLYSQDQGTIDTGLSFLSIFGNAFIFTLISVALIIGILFGINMLFGTEWSFKSIVSIYGAHMTPVIIFTIATFLLILLKSYTYGSFFILIYIALLVTAIPVYLISSLLSKVEKPVDPFFGYFIYLIAVAIIFAIFAGIVIDSTFGELIDEFMYYY